MEQPGSCHVQPCSQQRTQRAHHSKGHSAGVGPDGALDQRRGDGPDDHVGMADLQRLAPVRFQIFEQHYPGRLARRRAALAFRRDVAVDGQWSGLSHARLCLRRFAKKLLPITPEGVISDARAALTGKLSHDDLSKYNYVQKLLYAGVIVIGVLIVLSGLAIWKPVQLQYLTALFGGYDVARYVHFICMAAIVAFLVVHVALALLVPKSLRAMIIGR